MANSTLERGACVAPFLQLSKFPSTEGFLPGRLCAPVPSSQGTIECCLPCPIADWVYSDRFQQFPTIASWLNVAGMVCCGTLLLSYLVLPVERTSRHYLTVGLVLAICLIQLGFIVPLGAKPDQCHDSITPNDMYSDLACAFSGACLLTGGFAAIVWGFLRSFSLHLQVCWNVIPGRRFFWGSVAVGVGVPVLFVAIALPTTGVSYRFGSSCHINHDKALQDYWVPLLAFAAVSTILQFATFGYCIRVYIKSLFDDDEALSDNNSGLPSYNASMRNITTKQAFRRIKTVVALQWRSILIVLVIIANVVFMATIFIFVDYTVSEAQHDFVKAKPWLLCLVVNNGDKNKCLDKAGKLVKSEGVVMAALILLSMSGFWTWLFLGRISMITGWVKLLTRRFRRSHDFVSVDARRFSADPRHYEMILSPPQTAHAAAPSSPNSFPVTRPRTADTKECGSPLAPSFRSNRLSRHSDGFGQDANYASPQLSFSTPRPPGAGTAQGREWDPASTPAKSSRWPGHR